MPLAPADGPPQPSHDDLRMVRAMTGRYGTQDAAVRAENEELKARIARYENAITWETSCLSCARVLDSAAAETERAEYAAEGDAQDECADEVRKIIARELSGEAGA